MDPLAGRVMSRTAPVRRDKGIGPTSQIGGCTGTGCGGQPHRLWFLQPEPVVLPTDGRSNLRAKLSLGTAGLSGEPLMTTGAFTYINCFLDTTHCLNPALPYRGQTHEVPRIPHCARLLICTGIPGHSSQCKQRSYWESEH